MSIALDVALYLREQKLDKPLSVAERGALFTLLFRVGSNPFTWISIDSLAIELDITEKNVRNYMKSLNSKGYIQTITNPDDKRKNLYRPAEFLINYHQKTNRVQTKNYRSKSTSNSEITGRNRPVNTGRNRPLSSNKKISKSLDTLSLEGNQNLPKDTYESNTISKEERETPPFSVDNFNDNNYPFNEHELNLCMQNKVDPKWVFQKFITWQRKKNKKKFQREDFQLWVMRENRGKSIKDEPKPYRGIDFTQKRLDREKAEREESYIH